MLTVCKRSWRRWLSCRRHNMFCIVLQFVNRTQEAASSASSRLRFRLQLRLRLCLRLCLAAHTKLAEAISNNRFRAHACCSNMLQAAMRDLATTCCNQSRFECRVRQFDKHCVVSFSALIDVAGNTIEPGLSEFTSISIWPSWTFSFPPNSLTNALSYDLSLSLSHS